MQRMSGKRCTPIPGHALHEKGLQRQIRRRRSTGQQPGTKSASRLGDKPVINRLSSGRCVPPSVYIGFRLFCFWRDVQATCSPCLGGYEGRLCPGRTVLSASSPARVRPAAPPCAAPTQPAGGMSGFWTRQVGKWSAALWSAVCQQRLGCGCSVVAVLEWGHTRVVR